MQLSKHFTLKEMTASMVAQRKAIDNTPGPGEIKNLGDLCYKVLEPLPPQPAVRVASNVNASPPFASLPKNDQFKLLFPNG